MSIKKFSDALNNHLVSLNKELKIKRLEQNQRSAERMKVLREKYNISDEEYEKILKKLEY